MATLTNALSYARAQAQTDSNGLTDANGIIFANEALLDIHRRLIKAGVDASQLQESTRDGTVDVGTYLYPTDMFFLKAIELNYSDTTNNGYITAEQIDVSNLSGNNSFSWLRSNQPKQYPKFDDRGDWYEIFPTPISGHNLTKLIKIFYFLEPTEFTATSDAISYPISLDYRTLAWRIAASYKKSLGDLNAGMAFDMEYTKHLEDMIGILGRGTQQPIKAVPIQDTGWGY